MLLRRQRDLALLEALKTEAFYVGSIGSRGNNEARRLRLLNHFDISVEELARLRGPVGVYIGRKTPPEISVSVMTKILVAKNDCGIPQNDPFAHVCAIRHAA